MRAERETELAAFIERTRAFLGRDPVVHTVICASVEFARRRPDRFEDASWFIVTGPGGEVTGVAIRAAPYPLAITPMDDAALAALADLVATEMPDVTGVSAPLPYADRFAALWAGRTGATA